MANRCVEREKQELQRLGFKVYAPHDDKGINDKANAKQDKLAERIVANDTEGMERSNIMIFDYLPHAQGTICEMGYVQHLKRASEKDIKIYVQCTDIRQGTDIFQTSRTEQSSVSINMCMA